MTAEDTIDLKLDGSESHTMMSDLSETQKQYAITFSEGIDVTDKVMVLQYGIEAQRKVKRLSESAHLNIPESDLNEIRSLLKKLLQDQNGFEKEANSKKNSTLSETQRAEQFRKQYGRFNSALTECARRLDILRSALLHHIDRMDDYYQDYMRIIREYDLYLFAGEYCLKNKCAKRQNELVRAASQSGLLEDAIKAQNYREDCQLFDKKLGDLSLSRELPLQMMSQLRLIQNTDTVMAENLKRLTMDIFPLYRNRIVLAMDKDGQPVDPIQFREANDALRSAVNTVLKEEDKEQEAQKNNLKIFENII